MLLQTIRLPACQNRQEQSFLIYRGDLECVTAPGNKQHKLKYHLQQALLEQKDYVATFGGPHSNHVAAFVARCVELGLKPLIVVRGETWATLTPTLSQAVRQGAVLFPSQRSDYRLGLNAEMKLAMDDFYQNNVYWVPEGGGGTFGVLGCLDWANDIYQQLDDDVHVCVASGTGTTAAGFAASRFRSLSVFSALKGAEDLVGVLNNHCRQADLSCQATVLDGYDESLHGGFGRVSDQLLDFLRVLKTLNPGIPLDPVYTSKMVFKVNQLVEQGLWLHKKTLFIHTGGLQGWQGLTNQQCPYDDYQCT